MHFGASRSKSFQEVVKSILTNQSKMQDKIAYFKELNVTTKDKICCMKSNNTKSKNGILYSLRF